MIPLFFLHFITFLNFTFTSAKKKTNQNKERTIVVIPFLILCIYASFFLHLWLWYYQ
ncbi:hypothetical protein BCR42DRAFT_399737 [Absidia repens]|uniref:Uncharacterized protein n=1 Tax=Absidia repens TaxID=90262 RepID=A0A1X2J0C0_9FUNG|nr:hypothetical protein BCR42DRAFT_399737 [Absidia repens]